MSRGRRSGAKLGAIDMFVVDCDQSTLMVESGDMITIHPVLQYYDVIARDMPLIGVIVRKLVDYKRVGGSAEPTRSLEQGQNRTDSGLIAGLTTILGQF